MAQGVHLAAQERVPHLPLANDCTTNSLQMPCYPVCVFILPVAFIIFLQQDFRKMSSERQVMCELQQSKEKQSSLHLIPLFLKVFSSPSELLLPNQDFSLLEEHSLAEVHRVERIVRESEAIFADKLCVFQLPKGIEYLFSF